MHKSVEIIGVPLDLGANQRGSNMGPAAMRIVGLHEKIKGLGYEVFDEGDLFVPVRETLPDYCKEENYRSNIKKVCAELAERTYQALESKRTPIVLGGDHSLAIGSISGISRYLKAQNQELGVIWFDAHADMNTPNSSNSGNIHGMPLASLLGRGDQNLIDIGFDGPKITPDHVVLIGIRDLDGEEQRICKKSGIRYYTMREIDERGILQVMKEAISIVGSTTSGIHVSFDLDGVDPLHAPGVSTPVDGGLTYRESHLALELIAESGKLLSMDFVELNPMNDKGHMSANFFVDLLQSTLGKSII
ncbi:MAG: arginase [Oligoflexales bacterium]